MSMLWVSRSICGELTADILKLLQSLLPGANPPIMMPKVGFGCTSQIPSGVQYEFGVWEQFAYLLHTLAEHMAK